MSTWNAESVNLTRLTSTHSSKGNYCGKEEGKVVCCGETQKSLA
jgi:hypothetical protein